jgi:hypothetical protein
MLTALEKVALRKEHLLLKVDPVTLDEPEIPADVPTLTTFKLLARARDQQHINYMIDSCNFYYGKIRLMHERSYWPWNIFEGASFEYWTDVTYGVLSTAEKDAAAFGGRVQRGWYCDNPGEREYWFLIFDDMDKAFKHVYHYLFKNPGTPGILETLTAYDPETV